MAINYNNKNESVLCEGVKLLQDMKIQDYNRWRMKDMNIRSLDISSQDYSSGKDLSGVYLNGLFQISLHVASSSFTMSSRMAIRYSTFISVCLL
jgi:hypothetical protein